MVDGGGEQVATMESVTEQVTGCELLTSTTATPMIERSMPSTEQPQLDALRLSDSEGSDESHNAVNIRVLYWFFVTYLSRVVVMPVSRGQRSRCGDLVVKCGRAAQAHSSRSGSHDCRSGPGT